MCVELGKNADGMVEFFEETLVNGLLRVVRHRTGQAESSIRNRPVDVGSLMHRRHFHHLAHGKEHGRRIGFLSKHIPRRKKVDEGHLERAVDPTVGERIGGAVIAALPVLCTGIIACIHIADEVFCELKIVLIFRCYTALHRREIGSPQIVFVEFALHDLVRIFVDIAIHAAPQRESGDQQTG